MLFTQDTFRSYDSALFSGNFDFDNFKPGVYGLTLAKLREIDGLGAKVLTKLATVFGVEDDVQVLQFMLDANLETKYCITPSFREGTNDAGVKDLYFVLGSVKFTLEDVFSSLGEEFILQPDIITLNTGADTKEIAGFTFVKNVKGIVKDTDKWSFSLAPSKDAEKASEQLVTVFGNSESLGDIYSKIVGSGLVASLSENYTFAKLKDLPHGTYKCSKFEHVDKVVKLVNGVRAGESARITGWKFQAVQAEAKYVVDVRETGFIGETITANPKILDIAGKDQSGSILITFNQSNDGIDWKIQNLDQSVTFGAGVVANLGESYEYAKLKELPFGLYKLGKLEWEDKTIQIKHGAKAGQMSRIANWKFEAVSAQDGKVYRVNASKTSFIGAAISANDAILKIAGTESGSNGYIYGIIDSHREVTQGVVVEGKVFIQEATAVGYANARKKVTLATEKNNTLPTLPASVAPVVLPALAPAITIEAVSMPVESKVAKPPVKSAAPVVDDEEFEPPF